MAPLTLKFLEQYIAPKVKELEDLKQIVAAQAEQINALLRLLEGIKRITAPDGTIGISIPYRVGIMTEWFLHQPAGQGAGLCVTTAVDPVALYVQHDGDQASDEQQIKGKRVALSVRNTDPNLKGTNVGIEVVTSNAPNGNIGIVNLAQYAPNALIKVNPAVTGELL